MFEEEKINIWKSPRNNRKRRGDKNEKQLKYSWKELYVPEKDVLDFRL